MNPILSRLGKLKALGIFSTLSAVVIWFGVVALTSGSAEAAVTFRATASAKVTSGSGGSITLIGSGSKATAGSGNVTPTLPTGWAQNDLLLCLTESYDNVVPTITGWTAIYNRTAGANHSASAFYKLAGAAESNPTVTHSGGSSVVAVCSAFRGVDTATPFDVAYAASAGADSATTTDSTISTGSLTTATANAVMLIASHQADNFSSLTVSTGGGLTWNQVTLQNYNGSGNADISVGLHQAGKATAGAIGPLVVTSNQTGQNTGVLLALRPASSGGGSPLTINKPTGTVSGDVMIASIAAVPSTVTITPPAGWNLIRTVTQTTSGTATSTSKLATYSRAAGPGEPASYTFSLTAHSGAVGGIASFIGADTITPVDVETGQATASSRNHTALSVTPTQPSGMLLTVHELASSRTWTVPTGMNERVDIASLTTNNALGIAMEMNTLALGVVAPTGSKLARVGGNADYGATQSLALRPSAALSCYTDTFTGADGAAASADWSVGNQGGGFGNPVIWNNSLRLTNASAQASTWATLQRLFPAAGNKIIVTFQHFAYGGSTGADGIGVILSDAAFAPQAGAFGGSLGYAPKQAAQGGDTTHRGFTGGWIGVGIDEYGNYSADTEGRNSTGVGLPAGPGARADAVAIRGSWYASDPTGYIGYGYLAGTAAGQNIDNLGSSAQAPGNYYRIIVDHSDGLHAYASVERDTGSGYTYMISPFDVKAMANQSAVPTNWYLSFTGATGASTNVHEIDNLQVCSLTMQTLAFDHLQIDHDGSGIPGVAKTITIKACANSDCSALYLGGVAATPTTAGVTWSPTSRTISGGQATFTLTKATPGSVALAATNGVNSNATRCFIGTTEDCTMVFSNFDAVETTSPVSNPGTPLYTKLAGTAFSVDVLAVTGTGSVNTSDNNTYRVDLVDPGAASGNCSDNNAGLTGTQNVTLASGRKAATITYSKAAPNVKVRIRNAAGTQIGCSSDNFAIRPAQLRITSATSNLIFTPNPTAAFVAGADFNLTATPYDTAGTAITQGYTGRPAFNAANIVDHIGGAINATALAQAFPTASGGAVSQTFQYRDAGTVTFNTDAVLDTSFTSVDSSKSPSECIANSAAAPVTSPTVAGTVGCNIGSTAFSIGRFKPDHFDVDAALTAAHNPNALNQFTYMGQATLGVTLIITAMSMDRSADLGVQPDVLPRYSGANGDVSSTRIKLASLATSGDNSGSALSLAGRLALPALAWTAGTYTANGSYAFSRAAAGPDGPYDNFALNLTITDSVDNVQIATVNDNNYADARNSATVAWTIADDPSSVSPLTTTRLRFGRLWLGNAYGSDKIDLVVPFEAQYWNGSAFIKNTFDSSTPLGGSNIALGNKQGGLSTYTGPIAVSATASGSGTITLTKPASPAAGSVDLVATLGAASGNCPGLGGASSAGLGYLGGKWCGANYDRDPVSRATFGVFGSSARKGPIYVRENY
jgi:MSHA biogenesis protein MshQ